eukprot:TRINITY_DN451_c0_g1_i4.p1 TRINITY_DN451_c0_g1~~TRINITY_DN451_c0_g1_i4.p1  ORF type:complete len:252 (+),score=51.97 TRINITY_DN451_c0_g1_i4:61-756(+)
MCIRDRYQRRVHGIFENLGLYYFRFNQRYDELQVDSFLNDLFSSAEVRKAISSEFSFNTPAVGKVSYEKLKCTMTNMDMFEVLEKREIVVEGYIKKRFDEFFDGITIQDLLRECILMEESEYYDVFSTEERQQFLFHVFTLLVLGGALCQYEDYITEYLKKTKELYKSLVSARKDPTSGSIFVESNVFRVKAIDDTQIWPEKSHPQNRLYVIVNPSIRQAVILYHKWRSYW